MEEHDQPQETVTSDAASSPVSEHQWEEVWEEEKGTVLRPYITSVRVAAQETAADVCVRGFPFLTHHHDCTC